MPRINKANLAVTGAASTDKTRHNLCTVFVQNDCTVATNGHMLARVTTPPQTEEDYPTDDGVVVLLVDMKQADKATLKGECDVVVENAESELRLRAGGTTLTTQPAKGTFPDYKQVIPTGTPSFTAAFNAHLLSKALAVAAKAINAKPAVVTLEFHDPKSPMRIVGTNQETGQTVEVVVMRARPKRTKEE